MDGDRRRALTQQAMRMAIEEFPVLPISICATPGPGGATA